MASARVIGIKIAGAGRRAVMTWQGFRFGLEPAGHQVIGAQFVHINN